MKNLFDSDKDVKLLQQRNILTNYDSTEKEVARCYMFIVYLLFDLLCIWISSYLPGTSQLFTYSLEKSQLTRWQLVMG
jgi:hypothetical protein